MKEPLLTRALQDEPLVPSDLRIWYEPAQIQEWIEDEINTLDWQNAQLVEYMSAHPSYQPKGMLCALTYAYATGRYDSEEILRELRAETKGAEASALELFSDAHAVSRFRRENRGLLKWALVQVFKRAVRARHGDFILPVGLKRLLLQTAVGRLDLARQIDSGQEGP